MRNKFLASLLAASALLSLRVMAQPQPEGPPTPPPATDAQTSVIQPPYPDAPEYTVNPSLPQGDTHEFIMYSEDSKIYPGVVRVQQLTRDSFDNNLIKPELNLSAPGRYERHVWVYVPKQLAPGKPAPFMVVQDGHTYFSRLVPVLDNMIAAHRLPAMIVIAPDSGGNDAQGSERGLEYDAMSDRYSNWVEQELLPAVSQKYGVTLTSDPEGRATLGGSSGASAAFTMAWYHPERYHKVLSYSGTFVNQAWPIDPKTPRGAWEYHDHLIAQAPKKPIRIWMEVGGKDNRYTNPESTWHNWPLANNRMAAIFKKKGYDYRYVFAVDAGHTDVHAIRHTLPDALEWLWRDYPKQ